MSIDAVRRSVLIALLCGFEGNCMNEQQWEAAARMYCRSVGLDPEAMVEDVTYRGGAWCTRHQWKHVVDELKRYDAMREAIEFGKSA